MRGGRVSGPPPDHPAAQITIKVFRNGALAVEGPVHEKEWCLAVLENAKDAVRNHHSPRPIVVPGKDTGLEVSDE